MKIRLMSDYCSTGLWDHSTDVMLYPDEVPIPYWLKLMIVDWLDEYVYDRPDYIKFSKDGEALAIKMRQNLSDDHRVFFFNDQKMLTSYDESEYMYEIVL